MKTSKELSDLILDKYPLVKDEVIRIPGNIELPYVVGNELCLYCSRLLLSDSPENIEQGIEILKFINQIRNSDEYDDGAKTMIVLECINGMITDDPEEIKQLKLARKYFTGEALYSLKGNTPSRMKLATQVLAEGDTPLDITAFTNWKKEKNKQRIFFPCDF